MRKFSRKKLYFVLIVFLVFCTIVIFNYQGNITVEKNFTESNRGFKNPNRGFYNLYRFMITDKTEDYQRLIKELYEKDENTSLTLVEINLQNYRDSGITEEGIANIESLFQALENIDKRLIVRFVYDWNGENEKYEPEMVDIILKHMEQLEDVLQRHSGQIFIIQGLFIGNWGEMNGTKYLGGEDLLLLAEKLDSVTEPSVYLAVRTPSQWREITGLQSASQKMLDAHTFAGRLSLYNDGMLGSESDYGTYGVREVDGKRISEREEELKFQDELCGRVPNGGEVIADNRYNDFDNALKDLAAMHVTYLNEGHDQAVLEKWKNTVVTEDGCFDGMDGYTYIERHLGYRLLIERACLTCDSKGLKIEMTMRNIGFAPVYAKAIPGLVVYDKEQDTYLLYEMNGDLRELSGGNESEKELVLTADIPKDKLRRTEYDVYFFVTDSSTGKRIFLAIEQDMEEYGYFVESIDLSNRFGI